MQNRQLSFGQSGKRLLPKNYLLQNIISGGSVARSGHIDYRGEEIESLLEHLPDPDDADIRLPAGVTEVNDFHRAPKKLDNYFVSKITKDSARFKFYNLTQGEQRRQNTT